MHLLDLRTPPAATRERLFLPLSDIRYAEIVLRVARDFYRLPEDLARSLAEQIYLHNLWAPSVDGLNLCFTMPRMTAIEYFGERGIDPPAIDEGAARRFARRTAISILKPRYRRVIVRFIRDAGNFDACARQLRATPKYLCGLLRAFHLKAFELSEYLMLNFEGLSPERQRMMRTYIDVRLSVASRIPLSELRNSSGR